MRLFAFQKSLLGIDLGASALKAVRLKPAGKTLKLDTVELIEHASADGNGNEQAVWDSLKALAQNRRIRKSRCVINAYGKAPLIRHLVLPPMPRNETREAIQWEAKKLINQPLEEIALDFLTKEGKDEAGHPHREVVLVAAEREAVKEVFLRARDSGLRVVAMDAGPLSLLNSIRYHHPGELHKTLMFIDSGAAKTEINIAKNGVLRFTRSIQTAGNDLTASLEKQLNLPFGEAERLKKTFGIAAGGPGKTAGGGPADQVREVLKESVDRLVLEVQRSLDYYRALFRDQLEGKIILSGGTPLMPGFAGHLASYFDVPVVVDDPFKGIAGGRAEEAYRAMAPRFSGCVGLALRGYLP